MNHDLALKGWKLLDPAKEQRAWSHLAFYPGDTGAGIREPYHSITFDVSFYYEAQNREALERELNVWVFKAFKEIRPSHSQLYALDWQHTAYEVSLDAFTPEQYNELYFQHNGLLRSDEDGTNYYLIEPFPDGDYHMFITPDLRNGLFGHPWNHTICVFGKETVHLLEISAPALLSRPIRRGHGLRWWERFWS